MKKETGLGFELDAAKEMADSFSFSCGTRCAVYSDSGEIVYEQSHGGDCCFCRKLSAELGLELDCKKLHFHGARQAERFGGRYIYFCPMGLSFTASPIMAEGHLAGGLVSGPMLISDVEDVEESQALEGRSMPTSVRQELHRELEALPRPDPRRLGYISRQLFATSLSISDSGQEIFASLRENRRQNYIGEYISRLKQSGETLRYPSEKEEELFRAVMRGDKARANEKLNEILGYIFFYVGDGDEAAARVEELFVVLGRAAVAGGADSRQVFEISSRYTRELRSLKSQEAVAGYLSRSINRYTELVFGMVGAKHSNAISRAIEYMGANFARNLSLTEVAEQVGYSPAYFSRIFKEEMGSTFKEYLNALRIERSKTLLLSGHISVAEVCHLVGFNDESYYCKIFRSVVGASPDKFRKRSRRIDSEKEYGLK